MVVLPRTDAKVATAKVATVQVAPVQVAPVQAAPVQAAPVAPALPGAPPPFQSNAQRPVKPLAPSPGPVAPVDAPVELWAVLLISVFLVSVPVCFQAPLVRLAPGVTLLLTALWVIVGRGLNQGWSSLLPGRLASQDTASRLAGQSWLGLGRAYWGQLISGFSWIWLAGAIYWGWFRTEPLWHLPIESLGLPFALWGLRQNRGLVGHFFFLGSLLGTAVTDLYFYLNQLLPHWRSVMLDLDFDLLHWVFQSAIAQMMTPYGLVTAVGLALFLLGLGIVVTALPRLHWWALSGAILSTLLVDGLFWLVAASA